MHGRRVSTGLPLWQQIKSAITVSSSKRLSGTFTQIITLLNVKNNLTIAPCEFRERLKNNM
jgi:hypothetical protein